MFFSPFFDSIAEKVDAHGGFFNGYLHLDRVNTFDDRYLHASHISRQQKQVLINTVHASQTYGEDDLAPRADR